MPSKNKQSSNRFTSLKGAFSSTHPSKHFHGKEAKPNIITPDYAEVSTPQLVAHSSGKNAPFSLSFKDKLVMKYHEDFCGLTEDNSENLIKKSTRQYRGKDAEITAMYNHIGFKPHSKFVNRKIAALTKKMNNREKRITQSDSEKKAETILMNAMNRQNQQNYEKKFHRKPPEPTVQPKKPVTAQPSTHTGSRPSRPVPNMPRNTVPPSHPVPRAPVPHIPSHPQHQSNPTMHDPEVIGRRQDSFVVRHTPNFRPPSRFRPIRNNNI